MNEITFTTNKKFIPLKKIFYSAKYFLLLIGVFMIHKNTNAQTTISSANQSGVWTLAGSPYLIQTSVLVPGGTTLRIEPGVHVKFSPNFQMDITGTLYSKGTDSLPIIFEAADTTGWYNDVIATGGWHGVHFNQYSGSGDTSAFVNCIVRDVKHGTVGNWNGIEALFVYRTLKIDSCKFYHNQSSYNMAEGVTILIQGGGSFEMAHCEVYDNNDRACVLRIGTGTYEPINIHHCHFHHNKIGATIWMLQSNVLFEYNEVDHNESIYDMSAIRISGFHATLRHNTIHHNISENEAPITSFCGNVDIDANLICNNHHTSGNCGLVDGGGGIHVMHNDGSSWDSTKYLIRNNVIANNYSPYYGGGIYCYNSVIKVMNNHIINNQAHFGGGGIFALGANTDLYMQNNIFYGNCNDLGYSGNIQLSAIHLITYHNNWSQFEIPHEIVGTATIFTGDTTHNIVGTDPLMYAPTLTCSYLEEALAADFKLHGASACIDAGDTVGSMHTSKDYIGSWRLMGYNIDIGAYELPSELGVSQYAAGSMQLAVYPNPSDGNFTISFSQPVSDCRIQIINSFGQIVYEAPSLHTSEENSVVKSRTLNLQLPSGIYFLKAHSKTLSEMKKIIFY